MRGLMRHGFTTIAAAGSLLVGVILLIAWIRSYSDGDVVGAPFGSATVVTIVSRRGEFQLKRLTETETPFTGAYEGDRRPGDERVFWEPATSSNKTWQVRWSLFPYEKGWSRIYGSFGAQHFNYTFGVILSAQSRVVVTGTKSVVTVPYWVLAGAVSLLTIFLSAAVVRKRLATRSATAGLCPSCGYDLRATPNRCPECGTTF